MLPMRDIIYYIIHDLNCYEKFNVRSRLRTQQFYWSTVQILQQQSAFWCFQLVQS